jgi:hypothetical protein
MKLFGYELKRASKPDASRDGRITSPSATDFGWYGTKLTPAQVRSLLSGMRAGSFTDGHDLFSEMQDTWHTLTPEAALAVVDAVPAGLSGLLAG